MSSSSGSSRVSDRIDQYRIVRRIALGGMAEILEAVDERSGRRVALKKILPHIATDPDFLDPQVFRKDSTLGCAGLLFMAVMTTIGVFNMFAQPWLLTHGGPGYSTNTLIIFLYRTAFEVMQFGYAAAIGVTIFILTAIFSFLQITLNRGFSSE